MTEDEAIDAIVTTLYEPGTIIMKLRDNQGLDRAELEHIRTAILFLIDVYRTRHVIPKRLSLAFVDIRTLMLSAHALYDEAEQDEIEDAVEELVEFAYRLFGADTET